MKKSIIFVTILLIIAICGLGVYVYLNKDIIFTSNVEDTNTNEVDAQKPKELSEEEKLAIKANEMLEKLTLDEKIGQLFLVRYPNDTNAAEIAKNNYLGGYLLFEKDFKNKTVEQVQNMINKVQDEVKIPLVMAVDEEGGTVVRISDNPNLAESKFKSPRQLYTSGGFDLIKQDVINKSNLLSKLGLNMNLAPVVDVSTDPSDYMYSRTLGEGVELTSEFAKTVIETSKSGNVTFCLKHFPGYGHNKDTHKVSSTDTRTYEEIINTAVPPFKAGISAGAEAVLISHNIIECMDSENPASISKTVHELLRNDLGFKGLIITDDLAMNAVSGIQDVYVKAVLAGNNLIITSDYQTAINSVKTAIENGVITEEQIDELVVKTLGWKINKNMIKEDETVENNNMTMGEMLNDVYGLAIDY